ncbi:MAG TPA: questin oxidase family protein [Trebonia sp.]|jgi:hypothetical protein|nr:questin oxidase family protein [Trebonia sp.]
MEATMPELAHDHDDAILDENLARLARTGPEYGGGLSNHGPMAAEALVRLGRADHVEAWVSGYLPRLDDAPRPGGPVTGHSWRDALGDERRVADWEAFFTGQLAQEPWRDVLARWWPRLIPGLAAAATHGIIRTAHAARGLDGDFSPERRAELAKGLAYWAAAYWEVPGGRRPAGDRSAGAAVDGIGRGATAPGPGLITDVLPAELAGDERFPAAVAALRPPADIQAGLLDLATTFARAFLVYGRRRPIGLLHAVTAPVAARSVLPLLPPEVARDTHDALWLAGAALYRVYASGATPEPVPPAAPLAPADLADKAVRSGDEHAIKLTEACLRLYAERPDPVLLHAAARASDLFTR